MRLTDREKTDLTDFLNEHIRRSSFSTRADLAGAASGNLFGLLEVTNRSLAKKLDGRKGLVVAARRLGFRINAGKGGSRAGAVVWEFIDLPN